MSDTEKILAAIGEINSKVTDLDTKVTDLDTKVTDLDTKVTDLDTKFTNLDSKFDDLAAATARGFNDVQKEINRLDQKIENRTDLLEGIMRTDMAKDRDRMQLLEVRVTKLETAVSTR